MHSRHRLLQIEEHRGQLGNHNSDLTIPPSPELATTPYLSLPHLQNTSSNTDATVGASSTENLSGVKEKSTFELNTVHEVSESISCHSLASDVASPSRVFTPKGSNLRRVLYCANAGDARAVLCRDGKAMRLTCDHKGTYGEEVEQITAVGGRVGLERVQNELEVTRSLGACHLKTLVIGKPYPFVKELDEKDEFIILACDGVSSTLAHDM